MGGWNKLVATQERGHCRNDMLARISTLLFVPLYKERLGSADGRINGRLKSWSQVSGRCRRSSGFVLASIERQEEIDFHCAMDKGWHLPKRRQRATRLPTVAGGRSKIG